MLPQASKNTVIDTDRSHWEPALQYDFLRARGIELIQQFAGSNWSDFNLHDPGVTILEYLCYALTDIAYRTTFPITDILADSRGLIDREKNGFFTREEILSSNPVTVNDYRKLLIDAIPALKNVWLEPVTTPYTASYCKGIYRVVIEPAHELIPAATTQQGSNNDPGIRQLVQTVREKLLQHRNLGDHFEGFHVLQPQPVYIKAAVIIQKNAAPESILSAIYEALEQIIDPAVAFHTEAELLEQGYAIEEIYSGPLLERGIIPDNALRKRTRELDPFTLTKTISAIHGVISVKKMLVSTDGTNYHEAVLQFDDHHFPFVVINESYPNITLYNDNYPIYIQKLDVLRKEHSINQKLKTAKVQKRVIPPLKGNYKSLQDYVSIQTLFPAIYGISEEGIPSGKPPAAIAKSRQLKAYLLFFEQLLANSLAQIGNISQLFAADVNTNDASYFFQPLYNVPDAKHILQAFTNENPEVTIPDWECFKSDPENAYVQALRQLMETDEQYKERKKRALDHMLARFNIAVQQHPVHLYEFYYDRENTEKKIDLEIKWKAAILQNLPVFTSNRIKADDYLTLPTAEDIENGFGKKMALLLNIKNTIRRRLSAITGQLQQQIQVAAHVMANHSAPPTITVQQQHAGWSQLPDISEQQVAPGAIDTLTSNVTFKGRTEKLYQWAIEANNYRIMPTHAAGYRETLLLFKPPAEQQWSMVSKHADDYTAIRAMKKTMQFFTEASIESEGFYILEHLLLKPPCEAAQHGFIFHDETSTPLIQQWGWQSFANREVAIQELLATAAAYTAGNYQAIAHHLQDCCLFYNNAANATQQQRAFMRPDKPAIEHLIHNLRRFSTQPTDFYPSFEYTVQLNDGAEITENFFNFRMTIVFPSWPARFQDKSFRELAEAMFREESPAHMNVSFLWLSLSQMKAYDELYFNWLEAIRTDANSSLARSLSQDLIRFLIAHGI
jgi:hypothetical protein